MIKDISTRQKATSLISLIMPVKNALPFLEPCLNSILKQSIFDWELIAIDDNSTDESYQVLIEYAKNDDRIKCYKSNGNGIIDALKTGYLQANGEYISRMDADDLMPQYKLETLYGIQKNKPNAIATGRVKYFSEGDLGLGYKNYEDWLNSLKTSSDHYREMYKECVIASPNWLIHRHTFNKIGGFNSTRYPEDYDLVFRVYRHKLNVIKTDDITHLWRDHSTRTSRTDNNYLDNRFLDLKLEYFSKIDFNPNKEMIIWGAGKKAKLIAKYMLKKGHDFRWISNNPKKLDHNIYGVKIENQDLLIGLKSPLIIIAVANQNEQAEIKTLLNKENLVSPSDYFFFC